jgi:peptidoglycan hydrolase-like protein with peptidoglycan-binding domain
MEIRDVQRALKREGFDPGPIDGVWGRRSISGLKAFQESRGLTVDGVLGPESLQALSAEGGGRRREAEPMPATPLVKFPVLSQRRITINRARTWHYRKTRPYTEPSNGPESLSPFRFWPDCIVNTSGYNFRKGQVTVKETVGKSP